MPTYEYMCSAGHRFERFQRMSEPPVDRCPECGEAAERLLSAGAGLLFKGSGFYITDYRSDAYRKDAAADSGSSSGESGGSSKPDASSKADTPSKASSKDSSSSKDAASKPSSGGTSGSGPAGAKGG